MATSATARRGAGSIAGWATFASVLGAGVVIVLATRLSTTLIDAATTAAARDALMRLAHGDPLLGASELRGLALVASVLVLQPLLVLAMMLAIELRSGPREREKKDYALIWLVQGGFLGFAALLNYAMTKIGPLPWPPLVRIGPADGIAALLAVTLPMYLVALFVGDFFVYWLHRAQHRFAILWRFHAVHHSPRDLDVLHNVNHPVDLIATLVLVGLPTAFLIGVYSGQLFVVAAFIAVQGHIHHMNVPMHYGALGPLLCDNRYHFVHHSLDRAESEANFVSYFPVIDRLFGTWRPPARGPLPATGLADGRPTRFVHYVMGRWPGHGA